MKLLSASYEHVNDILRILDPFIKEGTVLPREKEEIIKEIDNFFVAEIDGNIIGCTSVTDYGEGLYEIRSLAVQKEYHNKGIGKKLISMAMEHIIANRDPREIFALTLRPEVFLKIGFKQTSKSKFPRKIWNDCSKCLKVNSCDETAVFYKIK